MNYTSYFDVYTHKPSTPYGTNRSIKLAVIFE